MTLSLVVNARSSSEESGETKLCEQLARQGGPRATSLRRRFCDEDEEEEDDENDKRKRANVGRALDKRLAVRFLQKRMS